MPALATAQAWLLPSRASSRSARWSGQRWFLSGVETAPSEIESPRTTMVLPGPVGQHLDRGQIGAEREARLDREARRGGEVADVGDQPGLGPGLVTGAGAGLAGQVEADREAGQAVDLYLHRVAEDRRAGRHARRRAAAEGQHMVGAGLDGAVVAGDADMGGADLQRGGAEFVAEADPDPGAAGADSHDLAQGLVVVAGADRIAGPGRDQGRRQRRGGPAAQPVAGGRRGRSRRGQEAKAERQTYRLHASPKAIRCFGGS